MEYYCNIVAISCSVTGRKLIATGYEQFTARVVQAVSVLEVLLAATDRQRERQRQR